MLGGGFARRIIVGAQADADRRLVAGVGASRRTKRGARQAVGELCDLLPKKGANG